MDIAQVRPRLDLVDRVTSRDADSAELLSSALAPPGAPKLLALVCHRSEHVDSSACLEMLAASHLARSGHQVLIEPLSDDETGQLVQSSARGRSLPSPVVADILSKSGGVPLFAAELTRAVVDSRALEAPASGSVAVPSTLQGTLSMRLDHLGNRAWDKDDNGAIEAGEDDWSEH